MRPYLLKKLINRRINRYEYKRARPVLRSLPPEIYVEPTNLCQLRCALCPSGRREIQPVGRMDMDTFRRVLDALGPTARRVHLYNWGEPFLHDDLPEMIRYAKRFGAETVVSTNLNRLGRETAEAIVDAGLDFLNASIDGVSQEVYESYRIAGDVSKALENLRVLCRVKEEKASRFPRVDWQFLVTAQNESEMPEAERMARELGVRFHPKRMRVGLSEFDTTPGAEAAKADDRWIPKNEAFNRYKPRKRRREICKSLWDRVVISWRGWVAPCCQVFKSEHHFAQGFPDDFWSVWNGPEYVAARKLFGPDGGAEAEKLNLVCVPCKAAGNII